MTFNTLSKHKQALQERFQVRKIRVFGSFARGEQTRRSDVDILVEIEPSYITFDNCADLLLFLETAHFRDSCCRNNTLKQQHTDRSHS